MTFSDPLLAGADAELGQPLTQQCCIVNGQHQMPVRGELTSRFPTEACTKQLPNRDHSVSKYWVWLFQSQTGLHWSFSALRGACHTYGHWDGLEWQKMSREKSVGRDQRVGPGGGTRGWGQEAGPVVERGGTRRQAPGAEPGGLQPTVVE